MMPACLFALTHCPRCRRHYAMCPSPHNLRVMLYFAPDSPAWPPLGTSTGCFACYRCGANLILLQEVVALTAHRRWIPLHTAVARFAQAN